MSQEFQFDPKNLKLENIQSDRPTIGDDVSVVLWRLVRVFGLHSILEEETPTVIYFAGKQIGKMLGAKNMEEIKEKLVQLKIGTIDFPVANEEAVHVSIGECVTCAGIKPVLGQPICQLEAGIVVGALEVIYPDKKIIGEETECIGGLGDKVCMVECRLL